MIRIGALDAREQIPSGFGHSLDFRYVDDAIHEAATTIGVLVCKLEMRCGFGALECTSNVEPNLVRRNEPKLMRPNDQRLVFIVHHSQNHPDSYPIQRTCRQIHINRIDLRLYHAGEDLSGCGKAGNEKICSALEKQYGLKVEMTAKSDHQKLLADYAKAFVRGQQPAQPMAGIQARICRRKAGDPVRLSDNPGRRIVFLLDHRACHNIIGLTGYQIATTVLGWDPQYTRNKVEEGLKFDLVVFPENACKLGTWDNLLELAEATYPEIGAKLMRHRAALSAMTPKSLVEMERRQGYTFMEVDELGTNDPRFMTIARYVDATDTADAARAFLYHVVQCKDLFTGYGCTLDHNGNAGVPEYIMPDRPLEGLGAHVIIPIEIEIP
jgi:hypothetical protein